MKKFLKPETYKNFIIRNSIKNKNSFSINWKEINYNRIALINLLLKDFNNPSYLEIGCNKNKLFDSIYVEDKIGVDPIAGGNVRLTSDDFFKQNKKKFDLIFIDGLHEYHQVRRDFENAHKVLKPNGYILLHDMHPRNSYEEYTPRINNIWTGDCWKLAYEIITKGELIKIIKIDFGVGVYRNSNKEFILNETDFVNINKLNFNFFFENYNKFEILTFEEFKKSLEK